MELLRKAEKRLSVAINKAKGTLKSLGIQARKQEKARLLRIWDCRQKNLPILEEDLLKIREPDKEPTEIEALKCTAEFYPELVLVIGQIKSQLITRDKAIQDHLDQHEGVAIRLEREEEEIDPVDDLEDPLTDNDDSDIQSVSAISDGSSIDSIMRNADFVEF